MLPAALRPVKGIPLNINLIVRPEIGTSRASASCRISPNNQMTFTFEASGVTVPLHFRFCNPPARVGWPRSVCMTYRCRRWKENVSTFNTDRPSTPLQAILPAKVECKTLNWRQKPAMVSDDCHEWEKQKPAPELEAGFHAYKLISSSRLFALETITILETGGRANRSLHRYQIDRSLLGCVVSVRVAYHEFGTPHSLTADIRSNSLLAL